MKWFVLILALLHVIDVIGRLLSIAMDSYERPTPGTQAFNAVVNVGIAFGLFALWDQMP